jgi:hypothetical protein
MSVYKLGPLFRFIPNPPEAGMPGSFSIPISMMWHDDDLVGTGIWHATTIDENGEIVVPDYEIQTYSIVTIRVDAVDMVTADYTIQRSQTDLKFQLEGGNPREWFNFDENAPQTTLYAMFNLQDTPVEEYGSPKLFYGKYQYSDGPGYDPGFDKWLTFGWPHGPVFDELLYEGHEVLADSINATDADGNAYNYVADSIVHSGSQKYFHYILSE